MDKKNKTDRGSKKKKLIRTKRETIIIRAVTLMVILIAAFLIWYLIDSRSMLPALPDTESRNMNMNFYCASR